MSPVWLPSTPAAAPLTVAVQIWRVHWPTVASEQISAWLDAAEHEHARTFRHTPSRSRFVVGRAALRWLLASQLNLKPKDVRLDRNAHGKPGLHSQHASSLQFNVSHSGDWVLIALSRSAEVGADIETIRPMPQALALAERYFTAAEIATLRTCPELERETAFFGLWTQKEAQVKALGTGLANSLAQTLPSPWTLQQFTAAPGHPAAVAVRSADAVCTFHELTEALASWLNF